MNHWPVSQRGLTLLETILATLIVASCVIGIAAIYAQRQNIARGGRLHEHAVELAQQIASDIHREVGDKHNFETALGTVCNAKANAAEAAQIVACWQDRAEAELTNGSARISLDRDTVPMQYIVVVSWSEPRTGTASYVLRVTPGTDIAKSIPTSTSVAPNSTPAISAKTDSVAARAAD